MATSEVEDRDKGTCMACLCINKHKIVRGNLNMLGAYISCMTDKYIILAPYTNMTVFSTTQ